MGQQSGRPHGPIRLAHEPPFMLGVIEVHPPTRQIVRDGRKATVEPRVMQVLVALAQAGGTIITRDELIERCWDGRIVSENAINRVISRVRQVAAEFGQDSFQLETITKVGYRIVTSSGATSGAGAGGPDQHVAKSVTRRRLLAGAAVAGGAAAILLWSGSGRDRDREKAKQLVAQGRELLGYGIRDRAVQAAAYFREATRADPSYAEAWGALALAEEDLARKRSAGKRALDLDPDNRDAWAALVLIPPQFGNWLACEANYRRHLRRYPDDWSVQWALANLLSDVGRWRDAIRVLTELASREPFLPLVRYRLANALWSAGRLHEADDLIDEALQRWPRHSAIWETKFRILTFTGRAAEALALANDRSSLPLDRDPEVYEPNLAVARAIDSGAPADVEAAVALSLRAVEREPLATPAAALNCAGLNRVGDALALYEGYYLGRGRWAAKHQSDPRAKASLFLFYPVTAALRLHARFGRLVDAIGLENYWRRVRIGPDYRLP